VHVPRLYQPQRLAHGDILELGEQAAHHVTHVLRLRPGEVIRVFDGQGREHEARLLEIRRAQVTIEVGKTAASTPESPLAVTLAQGIPRRDRMDMILQKTVELGVSAVQPLWTARSHARADGERIEKRMRHWQGVVISACEQCGRATLPALASPAEYRAWLTDGVPPGLRLLLDPEARHSLRDIPRPRAGDSILLLAGPEGGISAEETMLAAAAGFTRVRLGPRILRTETAALAMLAGLQVLWGDMH
jgi:16S rRNA (uracil1498-N3)-methyltransferase